MLPVGTYQLAAWLKNESPIARMLALDELRPKTRTFDTYGVKYVMTEEQYKRTYNSVQWNALDLIEVVW